MRAVKWVLAVVLFGCSPNVPAPAMDAGAGSPPELGSSLNVRVVEDSVRLEIHITNGTSSPIVLEFTSTQRYDFTVATAAGAGVWTWSAARSFAQVMESETLQPGESRRYMETWWGGGREGDYAVTARVVSTNYPVELRTTFRLPAE